MSDVARCLADGYSTAGSPGTGLGAISRLATTFEIYSRPGAGTVLVARLWAGRPAEAEGGGAEAGAVCLPKRGEEVSGDAWGVARDGDRAALIVADGLGHGPLAAEAARAAVKVFAESAALPPADVLRAAHGALRSTRGAAVAIAEVDFAARAVRYAGVGNVSGAILAGGRTRQMVSHNGTLGLEARRVQEFVYPFPPGARLVMHSDGLATHWRADAYPGLWHRNPSLVAGVLYRDFTRGRDDVTVAVLGETRRAA
jgi:hypothetical protein